MLDAVTSERDIVSLGSGIHKLKGTFEEFWSIYITGNYRIIFRFEDGDVYDVDYVDYQ